ncbi:hypothetical protein MLD38_039999 [Melastoma candidum]|uniref:Uncharacterized protein n=1 Tax=Melastoma candidum TaxID=119954 RepID=A0ACB9L4B3_9MYRT|nr:hypothetical protein MLD38_039999 [Melastoma candidum]
MALESYASLGKSDELSLKAVGTVSPTAASKAFDREVREVMSTKVFGDPWRPWCGWHVCFTYDIGVDNNTGRSPCSWPLLTRRLAVINKVNKRVDALAREVEEAMQRDLSDAVRNLENFVDAVCKPYQEEAQSRLDNLLAKQKELSNVAERIWVLRRDIQNLHIS